MADVRCSFRGACVADNNSVFILMQIFFFYYYIKLFCKLPFITIEFIFLFCLSGSCQLSVSSNVAFGIKIQNINHPNIDTDMIY